MPRGRALRLPEIRADDCFERPAEAAAALALSMSSFYRRAARDPDFPALYKTGPNMVAVLRSERLRYMRVLVERAAEAPSWAPSNLAAWREKRDASRPDAAQAEQPPAEPRKPRALATKHVPA